MENEINNFKEIYLRTKTPFGYEEGFDEVLEKMKHRKEPIFRHKFLYATLVIILLALLGSSLLIIPENSTISAIKKASFDAYNNIFNPKITPDVPVMDNVLRKKPTSTPTLNNAKPTTNPSQKNSTSGQKISNQKKYENSTNNNGNVQGVSDSEIPSNTQLQNNRSENSENSNANSSSDNKVNNGKNSNNPASEKSNGNSNNN